MFHVPTIVSVASPQDAAHVEKAIIEVGLVVSPVSITVDHVPLAPTATVAEEDTFILMESAKLVVGLMDFSSIIK